ncbi:ASPIC/UnbV domain-containing protein [Tunturiibacter gelidiferens]|uniref:ASPIC/UnbV domain-containing protein n=1 Tax=Tunturiibacter gelidiferens TaxID=3069689 RepID=UPI003D9AE9CD
MYLVANGTRQRADVLSGGSYESSNDQRPHFGIGDATAVDSVEIRWPSGSVEQITLTGVDRFFTVQEGKELSRVLSTRLERQRRTEKSADKRLTR